MEEPTTSQETTPTSPGPAPSTAPAVPLEQIASICDAAALTLKYWFDDGTMSASAALPKDPVIDGGIAPPGGGYAKNRCLAAGVQSTGSPGTATQLADALTWAADAARGTIVP